MQEDFNGTQTFSAIACLLLLAALASTLSVVGCGKSPSAKKDLKIGCLAYSEPIIQWVKEGLAPLGYKVEVVLFDANQLPATALKDGSIDGIIANHKPWIDTFSKQNNARLEMAKPYLFYSFFALYSTRHKKLEEIPQDATRLGLRRGDAAPRNRARVRILPEGCARSRRSSEGGRAGRGLRNRRRPRAPYWRRRARPYAER